jgi:hypothetical protein
MIQIKRGKTNSWKKQKQPLADGQPGYDKETHRLKIGDGKSSWDELPNAGGMSADDILCSEAEAQTKANKIKASNPISAIGSLLLNKLLKDDKPVITYGTEAPDKNTVGSIYLQQYDADPETDYIVESGGVQDGWSYKKWRSGLASCNITFEVKTSVQTAVGSLYKNSSNIDRLTYPITFKEPPSEVATVQSDNTLTWLASAKGANTENKTAQYSIISATKNTDSAIYNISIRVDGYWK